MMQKRYLKAYSDERGFASETDRANQARGAASHLPEVLRAVSVGDDDIDAIKAAFCRRFDEDLPRTESLMSVAMIGYRMALRDQGK